MNYKAIILIILIFLTSCRKPNNRSNTRRRNSKGNKAIGKQNKRIKK